MTARQTAGMQTSYTELARAAIAGMLAYGDADTLDIKTYLAAEGFNFGLGVVLDADGLIRPPRATGAVLTFDDDFESGNDINLDLNGVAMEEVSYASSSAATLAAVAAAIAAMDNVASAVADSGTKSIAITMDAGYGVEVTDVEVTGGSNQAEGTVTYNSSERYAGQPVYDPHQVAGVGFVTGKDIGVARRTGGIWAYVTASVKKGERAYLDVQDPAKLGQYTNVASGNIPTGGEFGADASAGELALLQVNLPQAGV